MVSLEISTLQAYIPSSLELRWEDGSGVGSEGTSSVSSCFRADLLAPLYLTLAGLFCTASL